MNVVFDQGTPRPLRSYRPDHTVHTRYELGWSELQNGLILGRAEADGYDLFINTDQNIQHQQKLARGGISVISDEHQPHPGNPARRKRRPRSFTNRIP